MGIQFNAINENETRPTCVGPRPVSLDLGERWEFFGLGHMRASRVFTLLGIEYDHCGSLPLADWRRGIMRARATFPRVAPQLTLGPEFIEGGHAGTRVVQDGPTPRIERMGAASHFGGISEEYLARRVDDLEGYIKAASAAGATAITWG